MLSEAQKALIRFNKIQAMKRRLTSFDYCTFSNVPDFIIEAFYGHCSYRKRLIVSTFGYLNGITFEQIVEMNQWHYFTDKQKRKVEELMKIWFEKPEYRMRYYSFEVVRGLVVYLDGKVRYHSRRCT